MSFWDDWGGIIICGAVLFLIICGLSFGALTRQRDIINKEFGTKYSRSDFFWAGSTIKEIVEGKKLRIDLQK